MIKSLTFFGVRKDRMENVPKATIMNEEKKRKPIGYILKSEQYVKSHKIK